MPTYTFETLTSDEFENLVRDLLQEEWGVTLESFMPGPDEGIDNRHLSTDDGTTIVQSKQYARTGYDGLLRELRKEAPKVERLDPDRYVVATSVSLSPGRKRAIAALFAPTEEDDVFGREDLNNLLGKYPEVEKRHTELWLDSSAVLEEMLDRSVQPVHEVALRGADAAEGAQGVGNQILNLLLAQDQVSGALRAALERQAESVAPLVESGRLAEAVDLLTRRIEETRSLGADAGPVLRGLLDHHLGALRVQLGKTLARAGDHIAAADQLAALGDPRAIPDALVFEAARLAHNVRDQEALRSLHDRLAEASPERRLTTLWGAIGDGDWERVLTALDAFEHGDSGRAQTRARALLELGRDRVRTAQLLDEAWVSASRPDQRLAIAVTTADLLEAVVDGEEEAPGLDRATLLTAATERLRAVADTAPDRPPFFVPAGVTVPTPVHGDKEAA